MVSYGIVGKAGAGIAA